MGRSTSCSARRSPAKSCTPSVRPNAECRQITRPGIAVTIPTFFGPVVLCDAGANPEPRPVHLWQYGIMAEVLAARTLGIAKPRVALMNIGAEEAKGTGMIRQVRDLLLGRQAAPASGLHAARG